ncbi:MAG: M48 family metallopeptidase [Pseudomonadota bacterium]
MRTTALRRYALLESTGLYHGSDAAPPQEVVVRFGESTLTLLDFHDTPLAHWALAGLRRLDGSRPGELRLAPDMEGEERLVIRDPQMIEAVEAVCAELDRAGPARRRRGLLLVLGGLGLAALAGALLFVLPDISGRLAAFVPQAQAVRLGETVSDDALRRLSPGGAPETCAEPEGRLALSRLAERLYRYAEAPLPVRLRVVRHPSLDALAAPGGRLVLTSGLVEAAETPEEIAALLAHQLGHVAARDPLREALRAAGPAGALAVALGGGPGAGAAAAMTAAALEPRYQPEAERAADAYAHALLTRAGLPAGALARVLEQARAGKAPKLMAHFMSDPDLDARIAAARKADRISGAPFRPALDDAEWIALRQICD